MGAQEGIYTTLDMSNQRDQQTELEDCGIKGTKERLE